MWYKNTYRRHLCDMHIDEWNNEFLSKFSPVDYVENLKRAKIKNAMIYFQSHVGLCYFPTKVGKMHNAFIGKESLIKQVVDLCHENDILVTGYYSLIYNNVEHDKHADWRMLDENGVSKRMSGGAQSSEFAGKSAVTRTGLCCCNNKDYRTFVLEQIKEMKDYFTVDGMFYDMLFWPHICYCDSCQKRWADEVGGEMPTKEDWSDKNWLFHMKKRREWMGEFAQWVTDVTKKIFGNISVEHNVAYSALPSATTANCEEVINACDYAGGDIYIDTYTNSFACKFYRNATKNQPFEYMISRAAPNLAAHTQIKSQHHLKSSLFLTTAHHGASLVIDAIDPVGTLNKDVYERIGEAYGELELYEPYLSGKPVEQIGVYYSLKSKFNPNNEPENTNYKSVTAIVRNMIENHILCGVTGTFDDINKYEILIAPNLTDEDEDDNQRIVDYVKNGGKLYLGGYNSSGLLKAFFGARVASLTEEKSNYFVPTEKSCSSFEYYTPQNPPGIWGVYPVMENFECNEILATLTLPYTKPTTAKFASIHSNPPGIPTDMPAMAIRNYGKGVVVWSAFSIENYSVYDHKRIFVNILKDYLGFKSVLKTDTDGDVEITAYEARNGIQINAVLLNSSYKARRVCDFNISYKCDKKPEKVLLLPNKKEIPFNYDGAYVSFDVNNFEIYKMYNIEF